MSLLATIRNFLNTAVIEDQWLQFVGYMLSFGGVIGLDVTSSHIAHVFASSVAYVGLGVSMAGWLFKKIYP